MIRPATAGAQPFGGLAVAAVSIFCVYVALGALITVIPVHVVDDLGAGTSAIGFATLMTGIGAAIGRLLAGPALRRLAWRWVATGAVACCVVSLVATAFVPSVAGFDALRSLQGFATAIFHSAVFSGILLEAGAERAAAGLAVASTPIYVGSAVGPTFGELLVGFGGTLAWFVLGGLVLLPLAFTLWSALSNPHQPHPQTGAVQVVTSDIPAITSELPIVTSEAPAPSAGGRRGRMRRLFRMVIFPASIIPGLAWVFILAPWSALQTYLPVIAGQFGIIWVGAVYFLFSGIVVAVRVFGARVLDRVPNDRQVAASCVAGVAGSVILLVFPVPAGVFSAAMLLGFCVAVGYGGLLRLATERARPREHGAAVSTFSLMLDSLTGVAVWLIAMGSTGGTNGAQLVQLGLVSACAGSMLFFSWSAFRIPRTAGGR